MSSNLSSMFGAGALAINPALALGMGAGLADTASQWYWNDKNYGLQERTYDYNRALQYFMASREDNSVQRRVADLKAAGLSPVLAAGQGAGTGPVIQTNTPQGVATTIGDKAGMLMSLMRMEADISKTYAENQLIDLQKSKIPYEIANLLSQTGKNLTAQAVDKASAYNTYKNAKLTDEKIIQEKIASSIQSNTGVSGESPIGRIINDLSGASTTVKSNSVKILNKASDNIKKRSNFTPFWTPEGNKQLQEQIDYLNRR